MQGDPFMAMIGGIRGKQATPVQFAAAPVTSIQPLSVVLFDKVYSGDELLVNHDLLPVDKRAEKIHGKLEGTIPPCSAGEGHGEMLISDGYEDLRITKTGLEVGDTVLAASGDGWNTVYIICKVVSGNAESDVTDSAS